MITCGSSILAGTFDRAGSWVEADRVHQPLLAAAVLEPHTLVAGHGFRCAKDLP
jgi:hypothetical protein